MKSMKNETSISNNSFLENISSYLTQIEKQVVELNEFSTSDFNLLNKHLKQQYSGVEDISGNIKAVFDITTGRSGKKLQADVASFNTGYSEKMADIDTVFEERNDDIDEIISGHKLLYIPLKNYLQNLITVNFLGNSLKFNVEFKLRQKNEVLGPLLLRFNDSIEQVKLLNTQFDELGIELVQKFENVVSKTGGLLEHNTYNLKSIRNYCNTIDKKLKEKFFEAKVKLPEIKRIQNQYSKNINKIIINLQYSDIIRQKIDHISDAQREMLNKISSIDAVITDEQLESHLIRIKDIADLQTAQLVRTSGEYQNAVKIISEKFVDIQKDTNALAFDILYFAGRKEVNEKDEFDFFFILETLKEIKAYVRQFVQDSDDLLDNYQQISSINKEFETLFVEYREVCNPIEKSIKQILQIAETYKEQSNEISDVYKQFESVSAALDKSKSEINQYQLLISEHAIAMSSENAVIGELNVEESLEFIKKIESETKEYNRKIKKILVETESVEEIVSENISKVLKKVQYYSFYEKTSKNIIGMMQELFKFVNVNSEKREFKIKNLEEQKAKYTMESERDTHKNVTGEDDSVKKHDDESEDEIEFF